jgi:hypothetical protein
VTAADAPWVLLIHQIPPKPDYLRVKIGRRLQKVGAVAVKNSVYMLPNRPESIEDFQWIRAEIVEAGGEASICLATFVDGSPIPEADDGGRGDYRGRTWVTRAGVFVDRIASAWLIRRFIDPEARFRFLARGARPARGELAFDMFEGEFTHEGDRCTFEVLCDRFAIDVPGLRDIAEIVHDIDCKDEKFAREDAPGIARTLEALTAATPDDTARLERGAVLLDDLLALFANAGDAA